MLRLAQIPRGAQVVGAIGFCEKPGCRDRFETEPLGEGVRVGPVHVGRQGNGRIALRFRLSFGLLLKPCPDTAHSHRMVNDHRLDHDLGRFLQRWPAESVQKSDNLVI